MGYAIVGYFDLESDKKIKEMWELMAYKEIDNYLITSENDAHFKIDIFDEVDVELVNSELEKIAKEHKKIDVHFKKFGFYPKKDKPFITLDIAENSEIIDLQKAIHTTFIKKGIEESRGFFSSGIWKPDIQLTISINKERLPKAVECLNNIELPFNGRLESIGLIEFHPAKQLFRVLLK